MRSGLQCRERWQRRPLKSEASQLRQRCNKSLQIRFGKNEVSQRNVAQLRTIAKRDNGGGCSREMLSTDYSDVDKCESAEG